MRRDPQDGGRMETQGAAARSPAEEGGIETPDDDELDAELERCFAEKAASHMSNVSDLILCVEVAGP